MTARESGSGLAISVNGAASTQYGRCSKDMGWLFDEVDGRSDYGRDLIVDITENNEITGAVIGVQVKGNRRFVQDGSWELPATPKDLRYWAESSVPVVGVVWNPDNGELRWVNLTAQLAATAPLRRSRAMDGSHARPPGRIWCCCPRRKS
jgi:hypothetical protein